LDTILTEETRNQNCLDMFHSYCVDEDSDIPLKATLKKRKPSTKPAYTLNLLEQFNNGCNFFP